MIYVNLFKSGNTHRITLPRVVCNGLRLKTGDTVRLQFVREGVVEITNQTRANDIERQKARKK